MAQPVENNTAVSCHQPITESDVTRDDIARRAYEFYERRGAEPGHDLDDWLMAEVELLALDSKTS